MIASIAPLKRMPKNIEQLSYLVPTNLSGEIQIGQLVKIPFRNKELFGIVLSTNDKNENKKKLKELSKIIWKRPVFSLKQLNFCIEISLFYNTPLGFILKSNLLPLQENKIKKIIEPTLDLVTQNIKATTKPIFQQYESFDQLNDYLDAIITNIETNQQILILFPTVEQLINFQKKNSSQDIAFVSSLSSTKEIFDIWLDIWMGKKNIIIGTRKALFLPFFNLSNIVIVDEANLNYKSWDMAPRFHIRDATMIMATQHNCQINLFGHTPSLNSYWFCHNKIFTGNIKLEAKKTNCELINITNEQKRGNYGLFSIEVLKNLTSKDNDNFFIYLNKRGSYSLLRCNDCGKVKKCSKCNNYLTFFVAENKLKCLFCRHEDIVNLHCDKCKGININLRGVGVEQVENEVRKLETASKKNIIRLDSDITPKYINYDVGNIIISTQAGWNLVDWSKLKLMVFLNADISLNIPEYKVNEDLWYTINSALYRLPSDSKLYIQTRQPDNLVFSSIFKPIDFYNNELINRKAFNYPPYRYLSRIVVCNKIRSKAINEADQLVVKLKQLTNKLDNVNISGPFESIPELFKGQYNQIIIIKTAWDKYKQVNKIAVKLLNYQHKFDPNPNQLLCLP